MTASFIISDSLPQADAARQHGGEVKSIGPHKFASTQFNLPDELAAKVKDLAASIPDHELAEDGREDEPHVTVKYGLHHDDPGPVRQVVAEHGSVKIRLGKTSLFSAADKPYEVVKIDVDSPDLHRLNQTIATLPHTDTHPVYQPHVTLAYVKPGHGAKYVGRNPLTGTEAALSDLIFSARDGSREVIPLGDKRIKIRQYVSATFRQWAVQHGYDQAVLILERVVTSAESKNHPTIAAAAELLARIKGSGAGQLYLIAESDTPALPHGSVARIFCAPDAAHRARRLAERTGARVVTTKALAAQSKGEDAESYAERQRSFLQAAKEESTAGQSLVVLTKYSPDEPRDDHGRWTEGGGGDSSSGASSSSGSSGGQSARDQYAQALAAYQSAHAAMLNQLSSESEQSLAKAGELSKQVISLSDNIEGTDDPESAHDTAYNALDEVVVQLHDAGEMSPADHYATLQQVVEKAREFRHESATKAGKQAAKQIIATAREAMHALKDYVKTQHEMNAVRRHEALLKRESQGKSFAPKHKMLELGRVKNLDAQGGELPQIDPAMLAKMDFITYGEDIEEGSNCSSCRFNEQINGQHQCTFQDEAKGIDGRGQPVNNRNCCAFWDRPGTVRDWQQPGHAGPVQKAMGQGSDPDRLIELKDIRQEDNYSCGAAATMAVGQYFGVGPATLEEWKQELGTNVKTSTRPQAIIDYLTSLGLHVEARQGMTIDDLRQCWQQGMPVITPIQEYGVPSKQASFLYGHYVVVIGAALGYVFVQDPSIDNALGKPGGDVTADQEDMATDQAPGRMLIDEATWLRVWHDSDADDNKYVRYGIIVGPPALSTPGNTGTI